MNNEEGGGASLTTDPAAGSSSGTDVSLDRFSAAALRGAERRLDERHRDLREADWRFSQERDKRYSERRDADRELARELRNADREATRLQREVDQEHFAHLNEQAARSIEERSHFATVELVNGMKDAFTAFKEEISARLDRQLGEREGGRSSREGLRLNSVWALGAIGTAVTVANFWISRH